MVISSVEKDTSLYRSKASLLEDGHISLQTDPHNWGIDKGSSTEFFTSFKDAYSSLGRKRFLRNLEQMISPMLFLGGALGFIADLSPENPVHLASPLIDAGIVVAGVVSFNDSIHNLSRLDIQSKAVDRLLKKLVDNYLFTQPKG